MTPLVISRNRVKELRARHSITQGQLSSYLGMKVSNFRKKEKEYGLWKENEMHLIIYYFNHFCGENLKLDDLFMAEIIDQ